MFLLCFSDSRTVASLTLLQLRVDRAPIQHEISYRMEDSFRYTEPQVTILECATLLFKENKAGGNEPYLQICSQERAHRIQAQI